MPGHGRALLVANHSGAIFPFDATMIATAIQKEHPLAPLGSGDGPQLGL